jgi:Lrp/AsnC family transcriptional regulator, leucine-responsive regulatory protein
MERERPDLDEIDRRLLAALQDDASASQAELAEKVGLSPSLVSRRISRLRETKVLKSVVGLINAERIGLTCSAIIRVRLRDHSAANVRSFRALIERMDEVTLCVMITGEADYLIRIVANDLPHFQRIVQSSLLQCAAIAHVESSIVLEHLKDTTVLPLREA